MREIHKGVHEPPCPLSICTNAIRLEKKTGDIPASNGRHTVVTEMAVSPRVPRRRRGFLEGLQQTHGTLATNIDTASGCSSHIQVEEVFIFWGEE